MNSGKTFLSLSLIHPRMAYTNSLTDNHLVIHTCTRTEDYVLRGSFFLLEKNDGNSLLPGICSFALMSLMAVARNHRSWTVIDSCDRR